jgi:hypothetical protein
MKGGSDVAENAIRIGPSPQMMDGLFFTRYQRYCWDFIPNHVHAFFRTVGLKCRNPTKKVFYVEISAIACVFNCRQYI